MVGNFPNSNKLLVFSIILIYQISANTLSEDRRLSLLEDKLQNLIKENIELNKKYLSIEKSNYELNEKYLSIEKSNYELNKKVEKLEKIINSRTPIYRLYNPHGDHFYCSTHEEMIRAQAISGFRYERVEFYAFPENTFKNN